MSRIMQVAAGLTATERRMLELAAEGLDNYDIADELAMETLTIGKAFQRVYCKLGIHGQVAPRMQRKEAIKLYLTGEAFDG
jgi:DNA-binding NarL/FixJ family response regulator